jgi:hypothetical protein
LNDAACRIFCPGPSSRIDFAPQPDELVMGVNRAATVGSACDVWAAGDTPMVEEYEPGA